jgi:hypothetical protein
MVSEGRQTAPPRQRRRTDDHDDAHMTTGNDREEAATGSTFPVARAVIDRGAGRGGARS